MYAAKRGNASEPALKGQLPLRPPWNILEPFESLWPWSQNLLDGCSHIDCTLHPMVVWAQYFVGNAQLHQKTSTPSISFQDSGPALAEQARAHTPFTQSTMYTMQDLQEGRRPGQQGCSRQKQSMDDIYSDVHDRNGLAEQSSFETVQSWFKDFWCIQGKGHSSLHISRMSFQGSGPVSAEPSRTHTPPNDHPGEKKEKPDCLVHPPLRSRQVLCMHEQCGRQAYVSLQGRRRVVEGGKTQPHLYDMPVLPNSAMLPLHVAALCPSCVI